MVHFLGCLQLFSVLSTINDNEHGSSFHTIIKVNPQKEIKGQVVKVKKTSMNGASSNCLLPKCIRDLATGKAAQAPSEMTLYIHTWVILASFPLPRAEHTYE